MKIASNTPGEWQTVKGICRVPSVAAALKILIWSQNTSLGTHYVDDVSLTPR